MFTPSNDAEATRLAIAWEIVRHSALEKTDPVHVAKVVGLVLRVVREASRPPRRLEGAVTVLAATPQNPYVAPGGSFQLRLNFRGGPTSFSVPVFVHICDGGGQIVLQDDHDPPTPTDAWSGGINYTREIAVPQETALGSYRVIVGLYDRDGSGERLPLKVEGGALPAGQDSYEIAKLNVR